MELDDAERGDEVTRTSFREERIDFGGSQLGPVGLGKSAGIEKAVGHPGLHGSVFLTLGMNQLRDTARRLSERLTHGLEAHGWVGVSEPEGRFVNICDGYGQVLVLLKL